jgi:hypothetical protein
VRFNDAAHLAGLPADSVGRAVAPDSLRQADPA